MNVEDLMKYMLNLFDNTDKELSDKYKELSKVDLELADLDHYTESHKLKAYEHAKINKLRQILRQEKRRQIKNDIAMLEVVKRFTDKYNNKLITGDIIQNLKEQEKLRKKQENPTYTYKTNILERLNKMEAKDEVQI